MDFGRSTVDILRFGEGFAQGGISGIVNDIFRSVSIAGSTGAVALKGAHVIRARSIPKGIAPKKPIVIGENMKRVQQYADEIGGHAYRPWKNDPFDYDLGMRRNKRWIQDMKREGREIIDIGPDFKRRSLGRDPSDLYNMERSQLTDYDNYTKVFERTGKTSGGVAGLDF